MKLYVVRHGQTDANVLHLFNGHNEFDLNDNGIEQAKLLAKSIKDLNINLIFSSPLKRAIHTASILNVNNLEIIQDDRLIERDYGKLTLKPVTLVKDKSKLYDFEKNEIEEVESFKSIYNRVANLIEELKEKYYDKNILIITHGDIVVAFQKYLNSHDKEYPTNCTLIKFEL